MDPTEVFDIRPMVVVTVMALTVWRPYSLIRRILATLSRLRSDALIGAGYVFDLSAFGLLWWQLSSWPAAGTTVDSGQADVLLGVAAAAAVGLGMNVLVSTLLTLDVERAEGDRLLALRTRHDHRHLRLRGINPMDPEVRWALLRIRQEEELERRAADEPDAMPVTAAPASADARAGSPAERESLTIDPIDVAPDHAESSTRETVRLEPTTVGPPPEEPAPEPDESRQAPDEPSDASWARPVEATPDAVAPTVAEMLDGEATQQIIADLVSEIASTENSARIISELVDEVAAEEPAEIAVEPFVPGADATTTEIEPAPSAPADEPPTDIAARLRARLGSGRVATTAAGRSPTIEPLGDDAPVSRLARRLDMADAQPTTTPRDLPAARIAAAAAAGAAGEDFASRRDRFAERLHQSGESGRSQRSLLERLEEYGITPNAGGGEPIVSLADELRHEEERWIPPRLYELEAVRYLLLIGIVVVAVTSAWIVTRTVPVGGELVDGRIPAEDLDRINVARRAFVTSLSVTLALVVLWCAVFLSHARRAGAPDVREWRAYSLLAAAAGVSIVAFIVDGDTRSTTSLLSVVGCLLAALVAVAFVAPIAQWFERRTIALITWPAGLAFVTLISWLGGLQSPIESTDALEAITFVAALQAIATAVVAVIAALSTSDLEDAIRLSPALAQTPRTAAFDSPAE
jgi:hypothetical protein